MAGLCGPWTPVPGVLGFVRPRWCIQPLGGPRQGRGGHCGTGWGRAARRPPCKPAVSGASPSGAGRIEPGRVAPRRQDGRRGLPRPCPGLRRVPRACREPRPIVRSRRGPLPEQGKVFWRSGPAAQLPLAVTTAIFRKPSPGRPARAGVPTRPIRNTGKGASSCFLSLAVSITDHGSGRSCATGAGPLQAENRPLQGLRFPRLRRGASDFPLDRIAARPGRFLSKRAERGEHHA
jgi:hypothetical protein